MANLNFKDEESARNWVDNYGGDFYDNTHSPSDNWESGCQNNSYTVHYDDNSDDDE